MTILVSSTLAMFHALYIRTRKAFLLQIVYQKSLGVIKRDSPVFVAGVSFIL